MPEEKQPHGGHRARMRQQFREQEGFDSFADHQILEFLLYYGNSRGDTNPLAHELLDTFGSLKGVLEARPEQLMAVKGVGEAQATLISMVVPLTRVWSRCAMQNPKQITTSTDLMAYCKALLLGRRTECFYVICADAQCRIIGCRRISEGSLSEVSAYPRLVMETALNYNAHGVFFCHNHPGGTCGPSQEDIASTHRLIQMLLTVGIRVLDHIIVAQDAAYSMAAHGDLQA